MKNRNLTLAGALVVASAGAFVAGRLSVPDAAATSAKENASPVPSRIVRAGGADAEAARREGGADRSSRVARRGEDTLAAMERIARTVDPLERTQAWLDYVNTLDPTEFESVVASFRALGLTDSRMGEYSMLLAAWAKNDPLAALDYAQAHTGNRFARNTILSVWAAGDPEGAIQWAKQHHQGDGANPWMIGVIQGLAQHDPHRASQLLAEMPFSEERGEALGAMIPHLLQQGPDAAKTWAEAITDERLRDGAIGRIAEGLARQDPAGTAAWLASMGGSAANSSMDDVVSAWMRQDEQGAVGYFQGLPAGEIRTNALRGIANQMALGDPHAASVFLDTYAADADDRVYQQFVWNSFGQAPDVAAQYIGRISDEQRRDGMYGRMLDGWLRRDFDAASNWIGGAQLPDPVRQRLDRRIREMQQRQQ